MTEQRDELGEPRDGADAYHLLPYYAQVRREELTGMLAPFVAATDAHACLVSRVVWLLGGIKPRDLQDRVVRDLAADVFEFLVAWRHSILEGQLGIGYPLGRRAYESLSLLSVCLQDAAFAQRWHEGRRIGNAEVRKALARLPFKESEDDLRELYAFFSKGAHPNRDLVPERYLGEGNGYVIGSIGLPNLALTVDHCLNILAMWFWFAAALGYYYRLAIDASDPDWGREYVSGTRDAQQLALQLTDEFNRLVDEQNRAPEAGENREARY